MAVLPKRGDEGWIAEVTMNEVATGWDILAKAAREIIRGKNLEPEFEAVLRDMGADEAGSAGDKDIK
jgi:hypothetical protein